MEQTNTGTIKNLSDLHEWDKNPKVISMDKYLQLKELVEKMGQFKPLLVTDDGTVLGGNMRMKAYTELGISQVWVSLLTFSQNEQALWQVTVNGKLSPNTYPSKEDAMFTYALADNDEKGHYDVEALVNMIPNYNVDFSQFGVSLSDLPSIENVVRDLEMPDVDDNSEEKPSAPSITIEFDRKEHFEVARPQLESIVNQFDGASILVKNG